MTLECRPHARASLGKSGGNPPAVCLRDWLCRTGSTAASAGILARLFLRTPLDSAASGIHWGSAARHTGDGRRPRRAAWTIFPGLYRFPAKICFETHLCLRCCSGLVHSARPLFHHWSSAFAGDHPAGNFGDDSSSASLLVSALLAAGLKYQRGSRRPVDSRQTAFLPN